MTTDLQIELPEAKDISTVSINGYNTVSSVLVSTLNTGCYSYTGNTGLNYGNVTLSSGAGSPYSWTNAPAIYTTNHTGTGLHVTSDADFEGDVKIKGVSLAKTLEDINKRLAILVPDPKKLEHFAALKKAYDHYKTLEALCELPVEENDDK
jgi:hypothetical protein